MRRGGIVTARRRLRERGKRIRRFAMTAGLVLALCALAMSDPLRERITSLVDAGVSAAFVFADTASEEREITLSELEIYALQLGVFDSEGRALSEAQRLASQGVPCAVWARDQMRLICGVALSRDALDLSLAGGNDAYIIRDRLPQVRLRLSCAADECEEAAAFAALPDALLGQLLSSDRVTLEEMCIQTRYLAEKALDDHPENAPYTELAQMLIDWCDEVTPEANEQKAEGYAAALMCSICREWRNALLEYHGASAESTASAQRTPSTAADVMPPAYPAPSPQG